MSWLARVRSVLAASLGRRRMERDMDAELRFHVSSYTEDLVRSGMPRGEAERRARIEFGNFEPLKEDCRQARGLRLLDETSQDLRYAGRMLRKSPGFATIAVLTLALGIGANTAIFSVVNAWILQPLPYSYPGQLVAIHSADTKLGTVSAVAPADLNYWRQGSPVFEQVCGWTAPVFTFMHGDEPEQVEGARVSPEFFSMLGVTPRLGRTFGSSDDQPGAPRVVMISDSFWRTRFASDPGIIGKTIRLDDDNVTVVGVLAASFHLPLMGKASVWAPLGLSEADRKDRRSRYLQVIARMKPGIKLSRASGFLKTAASILEASYPETNKNRSVRLETLSDEIGKQAGNEQALIVFGLVICVLLIACVNVANLIVGRAVSRQKEMAVRLAIGAGRGRLLRQLLTENLALFVLGGAFSVIVAMWGVHWMAQSLPYDIRDFLPNSGVLRVDAPVLLYTLGIALLTGLLFGFAPAFHCWRIDVNQRLKQASANVSAGGGSTRLKNYLIVAEMSLALIVLVASGLLVKGLVRMYTSDPGFNPNGLVSARIVLSTARYSDPKRVEKFYNDVLEQARLLPAVKAAAAGMLVPYAGNSMTIRYSIEGQAAVSPGDLPLTRLDITTPDYFRVMEIPLLQGRVFNEQDRSESLPVAIINQTLAQLHWPRGNPIGQRIRYGMNQAKVVTIVGVVQDTKGQNETDTLQTQAYVPLSQLPARAMRLVLRTDAPDIAAGIRRAAQAVDKGQAIAEIQSMDQLMVNVRAPYVIVGQITGFFAAVALFLASLGIYGVMAYSVAARSQEFGIRMALGAARRDLLSLVMGQGLKLSSAGLVIGLAGAFGVTRLMTAVLYHVSPTDAYTFTLISVLLFVVAAIACYVPARRASSVDPTKALRYE